MGTPIHRFVAGEDGATAIEYGLIMSIVFLFVLVAMWQFSDAATAMWMSIATHV